MFAGKLTREERLRLEVMDFYHRQGTKNVRLICRRYGIHHSTFYRWKKRFNPRNLSSLKSKKRGPKVGRTIPWNVVVEVCVWKRQNPGKGAEYLYQLYLTEGKKPPCSQSSMYRWWKRRGLLEVRKKRKRRSLPLVRGVQAPGDLVQVDTKHLPWGRYQYTAIDKFSKKRFLWVYEKLTMASSRDFLERLVKAFPFKIKRYRLTMVLSFNLFSLMHLKTMVSAINIPGYTHQTRMAVLKEVTGLMKMNSTGS